MGKGRHPLILIGLSLSVVVPSEHVGGSTVEFIHRAARMRGAET